MARRKNSSLWDYDPIVALVKAGVDASKRFQKSPYVGLDPIAALGTAAGRAVKKSTRSGAKKMPSKPAPSKPKRKPMPTKPGAKPSRKPMPARPRGSKPARKQMPYKKAR